MLATARCVNPPRSPMANLIMRSRLALALILAALATSSAQAQARDTVVIVSVSPAGNLRYGTPTEFAFVADVTLASADSGALVAGFNLDDPLKYRMIASLAIHRGTQRVTLRATVPPVDWSARGARFAYIVNIRPLEVPSADGISRALATVRGSFGTIRPEFGTIREGAAAQQATAEPTYFEFQVTTPARHAPGSTAPRYPPELKAAGVEGEVLVQFVVDTLGLPVLQTFRVLKSSHGEFTESIKAALPEMKFVPAELNGRKVRQLVQQPFVFAIQKKDSTAATAGGIRTPTPRPALPPVSVTPAPRSGTVRGWTIAQRLTVDSGNGAAAVIMFARLLGTAGRTRVEIESPARVTMGEMVSLVDSATGRMTLLLPTLKSGSVMKTQRRDDAPVSASFRPMPHGIKDLGSAEAIAGLPTRHYHVTGTTELRFNLGARACVVAKQTVMEYWTTTDPTYTAIHRRSRALGTAMPGTSSIPLTAADSSDPSMLGSFLKVVAHDVGPVRDSKGAVTVTGEILSYSEGSLEASLFEPPEGYQLRDLTSVVPPATLDSLRTATTKRVFEQWVDTTKVVPGVTTRCTVSKVR